MVFKASKKRERKPVERVGKGTPIHPSYALELWYRKEIQYIVNEMISDYKNEINSALEQKQVQKFYATDSAADILTSLMSRLKRKWNQIFSRVATNLSTNFVNKVDEQCTAATFSSLSVAGLQAPEKKYTEAIQNTLQSAQEFNKTLVTNISEELHNKIYNSVMLSLTSPNPEQQGAAGIQSALRDVTDFSEKRIKFIAEDQTSKLYAVLSDERMEQNGVEEFEWMHSGGGKEPRICHEKMDGMRFKINDPRLWEVNGVLGLKKGDLGPPGWAPHCRCRKRPII